MAGLLSYLHTYSRPASELCATYVHGRISDVVIVYIAIVSREKSQGVKRNLLRQRRLSRDDHFHIHLLSSLFLGASHFDGGFPTSMVDD